MKIPPDSLEKYAQFIRGADTKALFSETEQLELISQGILKLAADEGSESSVALLSLFILHSTDSTLIQDSFALLSDLASRGNPLASEELFDLFLTYHLSQAGDIIQKLHIRSRQNARNAMTYLTTGQLTNLYALKRALYHLQSYYRQISPMEQKRVLGMAQKVSLLDWSSTVEFLEALQPNTFEEGQKIYLSLTQSSKRFFLGQLIHGVIKKQVHALEFVLFLYIKTSEPILKHLLNHIAPDQFLADLYALFLLMDEQWLNYLAYDPGSKYLHQLYDQVDGETQAKIIQKTRAAGIDFLISSTNHHKPVGISELSYGDWEVIFQSLGKAGDAARIWKLLQVAPPFWSALLLQQLMDLDWKPEQSDELAFYSTLINAKPETPHPVQISLLIPDSSIQLEPTSTILAMQNASLACYSESKQAISIYNDFPASQQNQSVIYPPRPLTTASAFSPDGRYLCWADIDQQINLYDRQQDKIVKRFPAHSNSIRSLLVSNDQYHLYSAGFDGLLQSWRFPDGSFEKKIYESQNEIYAMVFSSTDELLITADIAGNIHVFSINHSTYLHTMKANSSPILHLSNPLQGIIAAATAENIIFIWNYHSGKLLTQIQTDKFHNKISGMQLTSSAQFLLVTTSSGEVSIIDPLSGTLYECTAFENSPVLKIALKDDEIWLFHRSGKANLMKNSVWQQLMSPLKSTENQRLMRITEIQSKPAITTEQNKWLEFTKSLLLWQKRYDIDIEFAPTSIELDDFLITL